MIVGYTKELAARLTMPEDLADLNEVHQAAERAIALTRQLLGISRRQVVRAEPLDLTAVVLDTTRLLQRVIGSRVRVETRLAPAPGRILADRGQLEQVLLNLVVNARDAMPEGGLLSIETADERGHVVLTVRDSGHGMDAETRRRLFEPFFTTKDASRGTGLGLYIVRGIVNQAGGTIDVESLPGLGSVFRARFPRMASAPEAVPDPGGVPAVVPRSGGAETVLVVEDDAVVRRLAVRLLRAAGYSVLPAEGPEQALEIARSHRDPIALVLTDMSMPSASGHELFARLRPIHPESRVLYMSGLPGDVMRGEGLLEADAPVLDKPFSNESLVAKVREVLGA